MNRELTDAWQDAREAFCGYHGVVGIGYGPKLRDGEVAADRAIVVLVHQKLSREAVREGELIPPTFEEFPTDVRTPRLTLDPKEAAGAPEGDWCLTDYQWLDWNKVNEVWEHQRADREEAGDG